MTKKELLVLLEKFPDDAEVFIGYQEGTDTAKSGWTMFDIDEEEVQYLDHYWSYGNCSPRPPREKQNAIVIEWG
jgi:hypothetical protein